MPQRKIQSHATGVEYLQTRLSQPGRVAIRKIDDRKPVTANLLEERYADMEDEVDMVANVIAQTQIDTPSSDAILTANGYANKAALKGALVKIDSDNWNGTLRAMLREGACIYKAVYQQEIVGVVVAIRLTKEFPAQSGTCVNPASRELPFPKTSDLKAVKAYAKCGEKDKEFMSQLCGHLNSHIRHNGAGRLWELSALGVTKGFRHRGIGQALVRHALSRVPPGDRVIIQAEPGMETMYQRLGFTYATLGSDTVHTITLKPEWEKGDRCLVSPMMTLTKTTLKNL